MAGGGGVGQNAAPLSNGGGGNLLASGFASTELRPQASFDGVAPVLEGGLRTGGPGMGPPREMVQQLAPQQQISPFSGFTGVADYSPTATGNSGIFSGGTPGQGQANFQVSDAQKASLLAQQAQRDQQVQRVQMAPQISPFVQQMMMQRQMPQFNPFQQQMRGLPAALMQMQGRLNQPMMRGPMPQYQNPALGFRPNMQQVQQNLNRVQPSVAYQRRLAPEEAAQQLITGSYDVGYGSGGG